MSGRLTTHVLDTARGRPAAGVPIELLRLDGGARNCSPPPTNADGRTDEPLLAGDDSSAGDYELLFAVGDYFARRDRPPSSTACRSASPIADADAHYHVPLLVSPWSYSTYRGS